MASSERRQVLDWKRAAERQGWTVLISRGHLKWYTPDGRRACSSPSTPGGGNRSIDNIRARLRRAGLKI